jgi:hypothetical protein
MPVQYQSDPVYNVKPQVQTKPMPMGQPQAFSGVTTAGGLQQATGNPTYTTNVNPSGNGGEIRMAGMSDAASGWMNDNANRTQWNTDYGPVDTGVDAFIQFGDRMYDQSMSRLQPQMDSRNEALAQSLINRGLQPGTDAYNAEMQRMDQMNNDQLNGLALGAEQLGLQAQNQYFGQEMANNNFGLQQANQNWGQESFYDQLDNQRGIAGLSAAASMAGSAASANASRYAADQQNYRADLANAMGLNQLNENARQFNATDAFRNQGQDQAYTLGLGNLGLGYMDRELNAWNAQQNANNNWWNQGSGVVGMAPGTNFTGVGNVTGQMVNQGNQLANAQAAQNQGIMQLGGALIGLSDIRLKENIVRVGSVKGVNVYDFDYIDKSIGSGRYRGVMAQEVMNDYPDAVISTPQGYAVDYNQLPVDMEVIA